jgi:hypothetical protein
MGKDKKIYLFRRDPVGLHLKKHIFEVTGMARIDEHGQVTSDHIGVAIVLVGIVPRIGIESFRQLHPLILLKDLKN